MLEFPHYISSVVGSPKNQDGSTEPCTDHETVLYSGYFRDFLMDDDIIAVMVNVLHSGDFY